MPADYSVSRNSLYSEKCELSILLTLVRKERQNDMAGDMNEATDEQPILGPLESEEERAERWKQMGARIKAIRGKRTQQAVADALAATVPESRRRTRAAIAQYESGANPPSLQTVHDLAHVLGASPDFLLTGEIPADLRENAVIISWAERGRRAAMLSLPPALIEEFGISGMKLEWVRLAVDASALGAQAGDYLLLDKSSNNITADGHLYLLNTPAGDSLARAEAITISDNTVMLTTGKNATISAPAGSVAALGRVVAVIKRGL